MTATAARTRSIFSKQCRVYVASPRKLLLAMLADKADVVAFKRKNHISAAIAKANRLARLANVLFRSATINIIFVMYQAANYPIPFVVWHFMFIENLIGRDSRT